MNNKLINRETISGKAAVTGFWILLAVIFIMWTVAFFQMAFIRGISVANVASFMLMIGSGLTLVCILLWIADITGICSLPPWVAKAIWATFIVGVLAAGGTLYKELLGGSPQGIRVERLVMLNESGIRTSVSIPPELTIDRIEARQSNIFKKDDLTIAAIVVVSGFLLDSAGNPSIRLEVTLLNSSSGLGDFTFSPTIKDAKEWKNHGALRNINLADIEHLVGDTKSAFQNEV